MLAHLRLQSYCIIVVIMVQLCHASSEPVFVTKNGYGDMVLMSMETYERLNFINTVYAKVEEAETDVAEKKVSYGLSHIDNLIKKYEQ